MSGVIKSWLRPSDESGPGGAAKTLPLARALGCNLLLKAYRDVKVGGYWNQIPSRRKWLGLLSAFIPRVHRLTFSLPQEWPLDFLQLYMDDAMGPRAWVADAKCHLFVQNLSTCWAPGGHTSSNMKPNEALPPLYRLVMPNIVTDT